MGEKIFYLNLSTAATPFSFPQPPSSQIKALSVSISFTPTTSLKFDWGVFLVKGYLCGNPLAESPYWSGKLLKNFC